MLTHAGEIAAIVFGCSVLVVVAITQLSGEVDDPNQYKGEVPETNGPVAYFVNHCAACHRSPEKAYTEYVPPRQGDALRAMIKTMAQTNAKSASDPQTLDQQYDLHTAIVEQKLYAWIDPDHSGQIVGEIIPGTTVWLQTPTARIKAATDAYRFALPDMPGTIQVERGEHRATLTPRDGE